MSSSEAKQRVSWQRLAGALAWPHGWQRPARTEEWAFEVAASDSRSFQFSQLVCFPWATLVDLLDRGHLERSKPFLEALSLAPPRTHLIRATVVQHIRLDPILPLLHELQISDLFWSHASVDMHVLEGIRLHPFPIYPVRVLDRRTEPPLIERSPAERRYLYSFIGAYSPGGYLTHTRQWISELPPRDDAFVALREMWHYESAVYLEQIAQQTTPPELRAQTDRNAQEYDSILCDSMFSLCPSGTGPNSIRLWESLGFGCIPVLLSDTLRLPGAAHEWDEAILRIPETREGVATLPTRLEGLRRNPARLDQMQQAGRRLWLRYCENGPATLLGTLADASWVRAQVSLYDSQRGN